MTIQECPNQGQKSTEEVPSTPLLLNAKQVAQLLGLPVSAVRALARSGSLPSLRLSPRRTRFTLEAILAWANSHIEGEGHGNP